MLESLTWVLYGLIASLGALVVIVLVARTSMVTRDIRTLLLGALLAAMVPTYFALVLQALSEKLGSPVSIGWWPLADWLVIALFAIIAHLSLQPLPDNGEDQPAGVPWAAKHWWLFYIPVILTAPVYMTKWLWDPADFMAFWGLASSHTEGLLMALGLLYAAIFLHVWFHQRQDSLLARFWFRGIGVVLAVWIFVDGVGPLLPATVYPPYLQASVSVLPHALFVLVLAQAADHHNALGPWAGLINRLLRIGLAAIFGILTGSAAAELLQENPLAVPTGTGVAVFAFAMVRLGLRLWLAPEDVASQAPSSGQAG